MLYSNEDFENFYVRYKAEALPKNITVKEFCIHNTVLWNLFDKWYRDTRHRIEPVSIKGRLSNMTDMEKDKPLDYLFDQNGRLTDQLTGVREELRLQREQADRNHRDLKSSLDRMEERAMIAENKAQAAEKKSGNGGRGKSKGRKTDRGTYQDDRVPYEYLRDERTQESDHRTQ